MVIGIVADDLTGAADSVAPFARLGLQANVGFVRKGKPRFPLAEGDARAYDTETREASAASPLISVIVRAATRRLVPFAPTLLYKKIDSTLRGHLRLELDAVRKELPGRLAIVCPAFPANGRTVESNVLSIQGVPWAESEFAPAASSGTRPCTVAEAFGYDGEATAASLTLDTVRSGVDALEAAWNRLAASGVQTLFCDAVTEADLDSLAQTLLQQPSRYLPVGSAGLTAALARGLPTKLLLDAPPPPDYAAFTQGRVLVVVGSRHPASRRQAALLAGRAGIQPVLAEYGKGWDACIAQISAQFNAGQRIVLLTTPDAEVDFSVRSVLALVAYQLHSKMLRPSQSRLDALIVTGGDTALPICHSFNAQGVRIEGETAPGIIYGRLHSNPAASQIFNGLPIVMKAGGFGTDETLAECLGLPAGGEYMESRPRIAVTMGDPTGVGPEIVLKALATAEARELCRPVVFGDVGWMQREAEALKLPLRVVAEGGAESEDPIVVRQATGADLRGARHGELSAQAGRAAAECVIAAAKAALAGEFAAIVTAPLNKEAIALGGFPYPGHTELLAEITQTPRYGMLLVTGSLRVVHVSTHVALREAIDRVKTARILECIRLGDRACRELGIAAPRIAVAGLNPHAGEHGLFGTEDAEEIAPAVVQAQCEGLDVSGPHPPDTVFARAAAGAFDLVVAMYHDQGHIPVKLHGFDSGVNVTIGLPIRRVSVDHGTAFDIAGQGIAREQSMLEAIRVAVQMIR